MEKAGKNLEDFTEDWFFKVGFPAFRTNLTKVYQSQAA